MATASEGESMRENVLRKLAIRATTDPEFLRRARKDLEGTLARYGYGLTGEERRLVEGLQRQTAGMSDVELAEAFGFEYPEKGSQEKAVIKHADDLALLMEAARLLPDGGEALRRDQGLGDEEYSDLAPQEEPLPPAEAENLFLEAHEELAENTMR
jgi:hypothetical protein